MMAILMFLVGSILVGIAVAGVIMVLLVLPLAFSAVLNEYKKEKRRNRE